MRGYVDPAAGGEKVAAAFLSCRALLARVLRRIVRPHDVEDILQDAFLRSFAAQERHALRDPRAFLLRKVTNLALNRGTRFLDTCRAAGSLPDACRRVVVLRKVHGLTQGEIAQEMGLTEIAVEQHLARGLLLCRESLEAAAYRPEPQPDGGSGNGSGSGRGDGRRSA